MLSTVQLDQIERIRNSVISDIKSAEFPDPIASVFRRKLSHFLTQTVDEIDLIDQVVAVVPEVMTAPA